MSKSRWSAIAFIIVSIFLCVSEQETSANEIYEILPRTESGIKRRVAYCQGTSYKDYLSTLQGLVQGLMKYGWIEKTPLPTFANATDTHSMWLWLAKNIKSDYLEFVQDAYYDMSLEKQSLPSTEQEMIQRLKMNHFDLIIAMGTLAGQALANNLHSTPTMVMSASDPLGAGIVKGIRDSGYDHVHAKLEPQKYSKQIEFFYDTVVFEKLGLVYNDTPIDRSYAGITFVEAVAEKKGFQVVPCLIKPEDAKQGESHYLKKVFECHQKLARTIDAFYLTVNPQIKLSKLPKLLTPFFEAKIPTYSQSGEDDVARGILLGTSNRSNNIYTGWFYAKTMASILNGISPRALPMVLEKPLTPAINLTTAHRIDFEVPLEILSIAGSIY